MLTEMRAWGQASHADNPAPVAPWVRPAGEMPERQT